MVTMNAEKGSIKIDVGPPTKAMPMESFSSSKWIWDVWKFAKEDTGRVKFAGKVGLAVVLASLLVLIREPYEVFGATNIIWAILTVAIMFEYSVGTTFNKGFNRAVGSLSAGIFAIVMIQVAMSCGHVVEPYVIGFSIFLVAFVTSFMRLWPSLSQYEYGFRVVLFTYCMIIISSYRMGNPIRTVVDRIYSIAIGGIIAVSVNVLVFPVWAGEQLHKELANSFTSVANALEECVNKYLNDDGSESEEFSKTITDEFPDEPAFKKCRATMNSSAKLESLANSARWEPPHGRFNHFFYPWTKYVKVGAVLRHCAYEVMALHGCLHSEIQAPHHLRITFRSEILEATTQASNLLRNLGTHVHDMQSNVYATLLHHLHSSTEHLQRSIDLHSHLLSTTHDPTSSFPAKTPPSKLTSTISFDPKAFSDCESMKKQHRRLFSWPSIEVDEFEEDGGLMPRMEALESTAALSLATFTSLLIEFVARMDHLVEAVDELGRMAKFREEGKC